MSPGMCPPHQKTPGTLSLLFNGTQNTSACSCTETWNAQNHATLKEV